MTIGRTENPGNPRQSAALKVEVLFGSGSRNPSGPAVIAPRQQTGHMIAVDPHVSFLVNALEPWARPHLIVAAHPWSKMRCQIRNECCARGRFQARLAESIPETRYVGRRIMISTDQLSASIHTSYTIAFAPRSGSSEICNLLSRNGLGVPSEFFQTLPHVTVGDEQDILAAARHVLSVIEGHTRNGIFGSKMAHDHRGRLDVVLARSVPQYRTLGDFLPNHRWVWLVRRNKIAQAVSLALAEQSGVWASSSDVTRSLIRPIFDFHHILSRLMVLCVCDIAWQVYFQTYDIKPYIVHYEDFFDNIVTSLRDLIYYLGGHQRDHHLRIDAATTLVHPAGNSDAIGDFIL